MATVNKDFKVKNGLVVEGANASVNGFDVLTKSSTDQTYIVGLIGGAATEENTPSTVVLRDANGDFVAGTITAETGFSGDLTGNVAGNVTGNVTGDLTGDVTGNVTGNLTGDVIGDVAGDVTGNLTGNVTGNVAGNLTGDVTGDVTGTVSDISNHDTGDLAEGTNLYFTDQRALDATNAAYDAAGSASTAESNATTYTDNLIGDATVDGTAGNTVKDRIDTAVSNLVDTAPAALDTLNELAAALGDDANFATTVATDIGEKVSKAGDTMTGLLTLSGAPTVDLHAATKKYVDDAVSGGVGSIDSDDVPEGTNNLYFTDERAQDALAAAIAAGTHENIVITYDDNANSISFVAENGVDDSTTTDLAEGTNLYFTDERAQDAIAAAISAGTQTNIVITYNDATNSFDFVAENGVDDSDTDDLTEGSSNLYFTDARAVSALEAVVPNFTEVDINSVATQVAATVNVPTAGIANAHQFTRADYDSAEYIVKVDDGTHTEVSKILLTLDSSDNISITEYGIVGTNGTLGTVSATTDGTNVTLQVTTANNNSDVTVAGTLIK